MPKLLDVLTSVFNRRSTQELSSITGAIDNVIKDTSTDISVLLKLQFIISSAEGIWLDEWGSWFGIPRSLNESDEFYRQRILAVASKPKNTVIALANAIRTYIGDPNLMVDVYEPYKNLMKYGISKYDSTDFYQGPTYMRFGVVDIRVPIEVTPELVDIINQIKGAGIKVYISQPTLIKVPPSTPPTAPPDPKSWSTWFGTWFDIYQIPGEADGSYSYKKRIILEAVSSPSNLHKLCSSIEKFSGNENLQVTLKKTHIFTYGVSKYDSNDNYQGIISMVFNTSKVSEEILEIINFIKSAGIDVQLQN